MFQVNTLPVSSFLVMSHFFSCFIILCSFSASLLFPVLWSDFPISQVFPITSPIAGLSIFTTLSYSISCILFMPHFIILSSFLVSCYTSPSSHTSWYNVTPFNLIPFPRMLLHYTFLSLCRYCPMFLYTLTCYNLSLFPVMPIMHSISCYPLTLYNLPAFFPGMPLCFMISSCFLLCCCILLFPVCLLCLTFPFPDIHLCPRLDLIPDPDPCVLCAFYRTGKAVCSRLSRMWRRFAGSCWTT